MGLEVTATHVIWAFAALAVVGGAMGAFFESAPDLVEASSERDDLQRERLATRLGSVTFCYDGAQQHVNLTVHNMGSIRLAPSEATVLVDGVVHEATASVRGAPGSDVWSPSEIAYFTVPGLADDPEKVMLATGRGVSYHAVETECRYVVSITVTPATATLPAGGTQDYTAVAYDQHGEVFEGLVFTWASAAGAMTALDGSTARLTATVAGTDLPVTATFGIVTGTANATVTPGAPASVAVTPTPSQVAAGGTQAFAATVYDAYGNVNATAPVTWSTNAGSIDGAGVLTAQTTAASGKSVTATSGSAAGSATVDVVPAAPASISVSPGVAGVAAGGTQAFVATTYDAYGNVNTTATVAWTTTAGTIDAAGTLTAQTAAANGLAVTATSGGASGSATVDVHPAAPSSLTLSPSSATLSAAATQAFAATVYDAYGNVNATAPVTWSTNAGSIDGAGLLTAQTTAASGKSVTATSGAASGSAGVTIVAAAPASITVAPDPANVTAGATQAFAATVFDAYGNVNSTSAVAWSTNAGSIDGAGVLTAQTTAATGRTVTATSGSASDSATVNIVAGPVASVTIAPTAPTVNTTRTQQFTAAGYDQYGNVVSNATFSWTAARGSVDASGLYTAPATVGSDNVTATSNGKSASATVSVIRTVHASAIQTYKAGVATTTFAKGETVETRVTLVDHNGLSVSGASVAIRITDPSGNSRLANGTATTNAQGITSYNYTLPNANLPGTWTITIINVWGSGLAYSPTDGVTTATFREQ